MEEAATFARAAAAVAWAVEMRLVLKVTVMRADVLGARQDGRDSGLVRGVPVHGVGAAPCRPSAGVVVVWRAGPL